MISAQTLTPLSQGKTAALPAIQALAGFFRIMHYTFGGDRKGRRKAGPFCFSNP